ncbi:MAG: MerR family transcriptional regulator [Firmicutes bacterium]|nr:MerR family transcriptional regulator [Bacillota bacterium]
MKRKDKLLTIGQFAALRGINKKTLMWYDEIGLFHPVYIHPETGYRYYDYHQSSALETILLLRELDVSLKEIQDFMENRSATGMKRMLEEKIHEVVDRIDHLRGIQRTLENYRDNMETLLTMDLSEILVVEKEERALVTVEIQNEISFDKQVEMITEKTKQYQPHRLHDASYGAMISVESLLAEDFDNYSRLFIEIPFPVKREGLHIQPGGSYLRAFYKGRWDDLPHRYEEIFQYAEAHGLKLTGYSYEMGINENVIERVEEYIVQIEIPICKGL